MGSNRSVLGPVVPLPVFAAVPSALVSVGVGRADAASGHRVYPIDYTKDGLTSFLVGNGQVPDPGQTQLLTPQQSSLRTLTRTVSYQSGAAR